jgi:hypothetical protein
VKRKALTCDQAMRLVVSCLIGSLAVLTGVLIGLIIVATTR